MTEPAPTPAPAPARVVRAEPPTRPARSTETPARTAAAARAQPAPPPTIDDIIPEAPEPIVAPPPAAERPRPTARSTFAARTTQNSAGASLPERRPRTERPPEPVRREAEFEDSILSAIADAVDVLADDPPAQPAAEPAPSTARPAPARPPAPPRRLRPRPSRCRRPAKPTRSATRSSGFSLRTARTASLGAAVHRIRTAHLAFGSASAEALSPNAARGTAR